MKVCPNCGAQLEDNAAFCVSCGAPLNGAQPQQPNQPQPQYQAQPQYYAPQPAYDPADHTAEFDPKDISDNKVFAMLPYLMSVIGIIIAALCAKESPYVQFHIRQAIKITVTQTLLGIVTAILVWTIIVPIVAAIAIVVLEVISIICFFQVCGGKAKEPAIIKSLSFLK